MRNESSFKDIFEDTIGTKIGNRKWYWSSSRSTLSTAHIIYYYTSFSKDQCKYCMALRLPGTWAMFVTGDTVSMDKNQTGSWCLGWCLNPLVSKVGIKFLVCLHSNQYVFIYSSLCYVSVNFGALYSFDQTSSSSHKIQKQGTNWAAYTFIVIIEHEFFGSLVLFL
jgi:hypothetical protein